MPSRAAGLLADLVAIPSVNPRVRPGDDAAASDEEGGESRVAAYVAEWAGGYGLDAEVAPVSPGRSNVYVEVAGTLPGTIVLQTHSDTVETDGMSHPYRLEERDGRWYGRGACDAKGQLAVFLAAIEQALDHDHHRVLLAVCVDEEEHFRGVSALCGSGLLDPPGTLGAIVGEPTGLACVTAHRGVVRGTITATGPGGHSSLAGQIENPIATMASVIDDLTGPVGDDLRALHHPLLGSPTLAVTTIRGGEAVNLLPRSVTVQYDRRTLPSEDPHGVWHDLAARLTADRPTVSVPEPFLVDVGLDTPVDAPFVRAFRDTLRRHGLPDEPLGVGFGSDASKIARLGVDAIVFGAGSIEVAHTVGEYVPDDELVSATQVITDLLTTADGAHTSMHISSSAKVTSPSKTSPT